MKEAIEKAIKRGLNPWHTKWIRESWGQTHVPSERFKYFICGDYTVRFAVNHCDWEYITYYELVFGTDFVDKLVGEGEFDKNKRKCKAKNLCSLCNKDKYTIADFHRREMANIKDIDKLKDYIRTLIEPPACAGR